ncbi:AMIN-like domain-containing (lipo)protein [Georgenia sp. Marseille-Q6866]
MTASRTTRTVAAASLAALALAACANDDGEPSPSSSTNPPPVVTEPTTGASPTEDPSASPEPGTDAPTDTPAPEEPTDAPTFGPAGTAQSAEPSGDLLLPVGLRVGDHEGFDRVVVELTGAGVPGWQVEYVDEAIEDGRGERVDVDGEAILSVYVSGTRYPDEGEEHYVPGEPLEGPDIVEEVHYLGTFEGLTQLFIGVDDGPADYRVFTLADPARLVIDIADPQD